MTPRAWALRLSNPMVTDYTLSVMIDTFFGVLR